MLAQFEKRAYTGSERVWVGKYRNLHNILHWHMEHELIACREGCARIMLNDTAYTLTAGMCLFCRSGSVHYIESDSDCTLLVCVFDEKLCPSVTAGHRLLCPLFPDRCGILQRLTDIRRELKEKPAFFAEKTDAMAAELLVDIFRTEPVCEIPEPDSPAINRFKDLLNHIDENYEDISFSAAARFMNLSDAYFSRYFKKQAGMTFSRYLSVVRIEKAVALLAAEPGMKTASLMSRCGFSTIRSFNRSFKEITGYTPRTIPAGFVLNTRTVPTARNTFDPTLSTAVLLTE